MMIHDVCSPSPLVHDLPMGIFYIELIEAVFDTEV